MKLKTYSINVDGFKYLICTYTKPILKEEKSIKGLEFNTVIINENKIRFK
jgi:hypothetical protein